MKQSPLHERHLARTAKMADFGGWLMPIEYPGAGVLAEHAAVRERVGLFDVSHLGKAKTPDAILPAKLANPRSLRHGKHPIHGLEQ